MRVIWPRRPPAPPPPLPAAARGRALAWVLLMAALAVLLVARVAAAPGPVSPRLPATLVLR
jgi:hypothetical protein